MNNDEKQNCQNQDKHVKNTESFSTVKSALKPTPRKCVHLGGNLIQIRHRNNTNKAKYKHKRNWKRFLPSWLRRAGRAGKVAAIEAAVTSRTTRVQICKQEQTSMQNGYHIMDHGSIEKNRTNKPSYERLISNYNFDEVNSEHKTSCERCKQKGRSLCGKHSSAIESGSRSSRPIHVGVASVSSDRTKAKTSNQSCSCSERRNKQPPKCPIRISSNHSNSCEPCKEKRTSTTSLCQESLLGQLRTYLQKLSSAHKISCQRCNSKASSSCKVSLLEQAREYLMSLFSNHQSGCQRCKQKDTTSYLETILQQAWSYLQKIASDQKIGCQQCKQKDRPTTADSDNNCCQHCLERGVPICCIHSPGKDVHKSSSQGCKSNTKPVCSKQYGSPPSQGILKYSSTHSTCSCSKDSLQEYAKKLANRADEVFRDYKSCPKVCLKKPSQESIKPEPRCKSTEVSKKPYCQYSSEGAQPVLIGSSHGSYCSLQAIVEPRKSCSGECKPSQSVEVPQDDPCKKHSSPTQSYHSNTNCAEPCQQEGQQEDDSNRPKPGLSLTMEPTDHKFCGRPKQCKHSRQASPSESAKSCTLPICTGACKSSEQEKAVPVHSPSCEGGCSNCVPPMHRKNSMVDAQYEAFLDEQFGRTVARQLLDKETLCRNGCDCMTCINRIQHSKPASSGDVNLSSEAHWKIPRLTL